MNRRAFLASLVAVPAVARTLDGGETVLSGYVSGRVLQAPVRLVGTNTVLENCDIIMAKRTSAAVIVDGPGPFSIRDNFIGPADWIAKQRRRALAWSGR